MDKTILINNINKLVDDSNLSRGAFADMVGIPRSNFSKILNGNYPCGEGVINKIVLAIGVRKEWLKTGKGNMYNDETSTDITYDCNNQNSINARIKRIIDEYSRRNKDFTQVIGEKRATVNNWVREGYSVGLSVILKIAQKFENIDLNWLLTGSGSMFKNISENSENLLKQSENQDRNINSIENLIIEIAKETVMSEIPEIIKAVGEAMRTSRVDENNNIQKYLDNQKESAVQVQKYIDNQKELTAMQIELIRDIVKILAKSEPEAKIIDTKLRQLNSKIG